MTAAVGTSASAQTSLAEFEVNLFIAMVKRARPRDVVPGQSGRCPRGHRTAWRRGHADGALWCEMCWWSTDVGRRVANGITRAPRKRGAQEDYQP